jgi:hypothetical protein
MDIWDFDLIEIYGEVVQLLWPESKVFESWVRKAGFQSDIADGGAVDQCLIARPALHISIVLRDFPLAGFNDIVHKCLQMRRPHKYVDLF